MNKDERPIEVGDRFETKDKRDGGRVVEVIAYVDGPRFTGDMRGRRFRVQTESHPKNPDAIGNVSRVSERTLRTKYERVSR